MTTHYEAHTTGKMLVISFFRRPSCVLLDVLKKYGFTYYRSTKTAVGAHFHLDALTAVETWNDQQNEGNFKVCGQTLCVNCKKAGYGDFSECCWERNFKPVPGWKAIRQDIKIATTEDDGHYTESYLVLKCPLYEREKRKAHA